MTHFTVGIIVPQGVNDVEDFIASLMEPYFEHDHAAPYVCYSLEQAAADLASSIHRLELILERKEPVYDIAKCRDILARLRSTTPEQKYEEAIDFVEDFDENGRPISTYNPDSKWDWYVIGGRWDGWINDKEASQESEHGQMGWFATLITENEHWDSDGKAILARYPGHRLVIVDAHI
jgi:hypothetical protein